MGRLFGYVRVSSKDQNEDRQVIALQNFGVCNEMITVEKQSGKDFNRPLYKKLMKKLKNGDTLVIKSIDRLGRNYSEIIEQWRIITKEKGAHVVVLDMPLLDTRQSGRDLTNTFIADLVLQILSYVAQTEREHIKQRQAEGIAAAKKRGIRFGRPSMPIPAKFFEVYTKWNKGEISARVAAKELGVAPNTFLEWVKNQEGVSTRQIRNNDFANYH